MNEKERKGKKVKEKEEKTGKKEKQGSNGKNKNKRGKKERKGKKRERIEHGRVREGGGGCAGPVSSRLVSHSSGSEGFRCMRQTSGATEDRESICGFMWLSLPRHPPSTTSSIPVSPPLPFSTHIPLPFPSSIPSLYHSSPPSIHSSRHTIYLAVISFSLHLARCSLLHCLDHLHLSLHSSISSIDTPSSSFFLPSTPLHLISLSYTFHPLHLSLHFYFFIPSFFNLTSFHFIIIHLFTLLILPSTCPFFHIPSLHSILPFTSSFFQIPSFHSSFFLPLHPSTLVPFTPFILRFILFASLSFPSPRWPSG